MGCVLQSVIGTGISEKNQDLEKSKMDYYLSQLHLGTQLEVVRDIIMLLFM